MSAGGLGPLGTLVRVACDLGPCSPSSEPRLLCRTEQHSCGVFLGIRNGKHGKEPGLRLVPSCCSLGNSSRFYYHLFISAFREHIVCACHRAWFRGCRDRSVSGIFRKQRCWRLFCPLWQQNGGVGCRRPPAPCPLPGSPSSAARAASPCHEEVSWFTRCSLSGQHMHNELFFFDDSACLRGPGARADSVAYA